MRVKELCFIGVIAAIEFVVFTSFSFILYLEFITISIVLFAMCFQTRQAVMGAVVFGILNLCVQGVTPWSMMYLFIYPVYSLLIGVLKGYLKKHFILLCLLCGILSFLTGQLVQLPFLMISDTITILYIIIGLKTSLIQGSMAAISCFICYKPIASVLKEIERRLN